MSMFESTFRLSTLVLAAAACIAMPAVARDNPEDAVSNPDKLQYSDVNMRYADMKKDFVRDGVLAEQLEGVRAIQPGMPQDKVKQTLGVPLTQTTGPRGQEWDYNFKLRQAQSGNLLVCQYKVVFDEAGAVRESVWRRRQCQQLMQR